MSSNDYKKLKPYAARVEYLAFKDEIMELINEGYSYSEIHRILYQAKKIKMTYRTLVYNIKKNVEKISDKKIDIIKDNEEKISNNKEKIKEEKNNISQNNIYEKSTNNKIIEIKDKNKKVETCIDTDKLI